MNRIMALVVSIVSLRTVSIALLVDDADSSANDRVSGYTAESVANYLDENPGVPLMLPVDLPAGYRWSGPTGAETHNDRVVSRESLFNPEPDSGLAVAVVCTHERDTRTSCSQGDRSFSETVRNVDVTVALFGSDSEAAAAYRTFHSQAFVASEDVDWFAPAS